MTAEQVTSVSRAEYLQVDVGPERLERVAGHVGATTGGTERHHLMTTALLRRLEAGARPRGAAPSARGVGC